VWTALSFIADKLAGWQAKLRPAGLSSAFIGDKD